MTKPATSESDVPREYMGGVITSPADAAAVALNPPSGVAGNLSFGAEAIAFASTITPDASTTVVKNIGTLTGNMTVNAPINRSAGRLIVFIFTQDSSGGRLINWNAAYLNPISPSRTPNSTSVVMFSDDGTSLQCVSNGQVLDNGGMVWNARHPIFNVKADASDETTKVQLLFTTAQNGGIAFLPSGTVATVAPLTATGVFILGSGAQACRLQSNNELGYANLAPTTVTYSSTVLTDTNASWTSSQWVNFPLNIGPGIWTTITANTATTLTYTAVGFTPAANTPYIIEPSFLTLTEGNGSGINTCGIEGVYLITPAGFTNGVRPRYTDGVRATGKVLLRDCKIARFGNGFVNASSTGHVTIQRCNLGGNYYGYYSPQNPSDHGDNFIFDSDLTGGSWAGLGVAANSSLISLLVLRTHLGGGPFGVYQELAPTGATPATGFMQNCTFIQTPFEGVGNGALVSANAFTAGSVAAFGGNIFLNASMSWGSSGVYVVATGRNYAVQVGQCSNLNTIAGTNRFINSPMFDGDIAAFYIDNLTDGEFRVEGGYQGKGNMPTANIRTGTVANFILVAYPASARIGSSSIATGQSTVTVTSGGVHLGPIPSLLPQVTPTGAGGLAGAFALMAGAVASSPPLCGSGGTDPTTGQPNKIPRPGVGAPSAGGAITTGSHVWGITYVNVFGESKLGYISAPVTIAGGNQTVLITSPVWPSYSYYSAVTSANVYRSAAGTTTPLKLVGSIGTSSGTLSDAIADGSLGASAPTTDTSGGTQFPVTLQPAAPTPGSNLGFSWAVPN